MKDKKIQVMIQVSDLNLPGVKRIQLRSFEDQRGFFSELYRDCFYKECGIDCFFVQDNHSYSKKGTIRGLHFQEGFGQAKLVSVIVGKIYDVFVDIRVDSPTFGYWGGIELDAKLHEQVFIPGCYAHGFAVLSEEAHVIYKCSKIYDPAKEKSIFYADPNIGIHWPISHPILSEKDLSAPKLAEVLL